ncbi:MCR_0457 family protein [Psychrobacter sp. I-STPA10]|uniref:MCR_0457 family protein n=1 Tax=Psychrobacter sp. I-STPA10 TaxID=2585769 RepID=UPI001E4B1E5B|nr:hypothetical protein [Psychrobacter sp. I-STPA10]
MIKHIQTSLSASRLKRLGFGLIISSIGLITQTVNAATSYNDMITIPVDLAGISTTKYEIAVMHVLSEICPPMLNTQQRQKFYKAYNIELQKLMPTIKNPKSAIQYLSTQQDYKQVLQSIRGWTSSISRNENKALCQDLADTNF